MGQIGRKIGAREDVSKILPTEERVDYADSTVKGLRLRVLPNGEKSFSLLYPTLRAFSDA